MSQNIFATAVKNYLPMAIPVSLDKLDEFSAGDVLIYSKKPRKLFPLRKHELDFTGFSLKTLLSGEQELNVSTAHTFLFDTDQSESSQEISVDVASDVDLKNSFTKLFSGGGSLKARGSGSKNVNVTTDFGKITHVSSDLVSRIINGTLQANLKHPVVKKALLNGGAMFVVTDIYKAQRCHVAVKESKAMSEGVEASVEAEDVGVSASEHVNEKKSSTTVVTRDQPTPLAYLLMKVNVDLEGLIDTELNTQFSNQLEVHYSNPMIMPIAASTSTTPPRASEAPPSKLPDSSTTDGLTSAPTPATREEDAPQAATTTTHHHHHYLYTLKDFQPFHSKSYTGVLEETKQWLTPFLANENLRKAFFNYTKSPKAYKTLNSLANYFLDVGNALRAGKTPPHNTLKNVTSIFAALTPMECDCEKRLNEISSIIVVAEATDELPQNIFQAIIDLPEDKRQALEKIILETPYEPGQHTYTDEDGHYMDPDLKPIMDCIGFSLPDNTHHLIHTKEETEGEEDSLAAALILLLASEKI